MLGKYLARSDPTNIHAQCEGGIGAVEICAFHGARTSMQMYESQNIYTKFPPKMDFSRRMVTAGFCRASSWNVLMFTNLEGIDENWIPAMNRRNRSEEGPGSFHIPQNHKNTNHQAIQTRCLHTVLITDIKNRSDSSTYYTLNNERIRHT